MLLRDMLIDHKDSIYNLTKDAAVKNMSTPILGMKMTGRYGSKSTMQFPDSIGNIEELRLLNYQGIPISIENDVGSIREGIDEDGHHWKHKFTVPYGFINNTVSQDNEEVDCFMGPVKNADTAYIIRQRIDGKVDEDKCFIGFATMADAIKTYIDHVDKPEMMGNVIEMPMHEFKKIVCNLQED